LRHYGVIYGWLGAFFYTGMAAGGLGYAIVHDRTSSYQGAILGSVFLLLASAGLFLILQVRGTKDASPNRTAEVAVNPALNQKEFP
jgi:hypothetical protein